jgi:hypothetical protein
MTIPVSVLLVFAGWAGAIDKRPLLLHASEQLPLFGEEVLMWKRLDLSALIAVLLISSCGDTTAPAPETLVGTWNATSVELVSVAEPSIRVDLVADLGATVMLVLSEDNDFTLTVTYAGEEPGGPWGTSSETKGIWRSTDILTLQTSPTNEWQFEIELDDDALTLTEADTSFDFGGDDAPEDAKLSLDLIRA